MAVTEFTSAVSGSGKTAIRCAAYLSRDFLPHTKKVLWTNYPIKIDAMVATVLENNKKLTDQEVRDRINIIPDDVLKSWQRYESTPQEFFEKIDLDGCRIAIDEIHNFCNASMPKAVLQSWKEFLGELRHRGCEFECLSQNKSKVHKAIQDEAGLRRYLFNSENKPDPLFSVLMGDWYQLKAKFITNRYNPTIFETEETECQGKWVVTRTNRYVLEPELFPLYDSYSAPHQGGNKSKGIIHPFQEKTKLQLIIWFLRRNILRIFPRLILTIFVLWLCFGGGLSTCIQGFIGLMEQMKPGSLTAIPHQQHVKNDSQPSIISVESQNSNTTEQQKTNEAQIELQKELDKLKADLAVAQKTIEDLKAEAARFSEIVAIFGNQVTLRSGITIELNEQIPIGPLKGRFIKGISHAKRRVILDDNTILPLAQ
jgi:Zonular occludens toxin (Zot)